MAGSPGNGIPGADPGGPRASSADRERAIVLLKAAFAQGRLAMDEFDARLGRALTSRTRAELAALTADIPALPDEPFPPPAPGGRRRAGRWAAAIAAVVLLGCAGVAVWGRPGSPAPAAGVPRYYVQQTIGQGTQQPVTVVRATTTGAITATVRSPWPQAHIAAITADRNQTFFMICQRTAGNSASAAVTGSRIYEFQVTASGQVRGYSLMPGGVLPGLQTGRLAVSADGSELAVTTTPGTAATIPTTVMVISTRTGARAWWHTPPAVPGTMTFGVGDLSFTADGRELAFLAVPRCPRGRCAPTGNGEEVRAVSPAAQGGSLASSRLLARQAALMPLATGYIDGAIISPDGSGVAVLEMNTPGPGPDNTISVVQVSAVTGRQLHLRYQVDTGNGFSYRLFGADPSGRYLLLDAGPTSGLVNGWIDGGRLIQLAPGQGDNVTAEAW